MRGKLRNIILFGLLRDMRVETRVPSFSATLQRCTWLAASDKRMPIRRTLSQMQSNSWNSERDTSFRQTGSLTKNNFFKLFLSFSFFRLWSYPWKKKFQKFTYFAKASTIVAFAMSRTIFNTASIVPRHHANFDQ